MNQSSPDDTRRTIFLLGLASLAETTAEVVSHLTPSYHVPGGEAGERGSVKAGSGKTLFNPAPVVEAVKKAARIEAGIARTLTKAGIAPESEEAAFLLSVLRKAQARSNDPRRDLAGHFELARCALAELTKEADRRIAAFESGEPVKVEPDEAPAVVPAVKPAPTDSLDKEPGIDDED